MNKEKKELLDKCIQLGYGEEVPNLGGIYVIPTQYKHDSGYKIMYIVGHTIHEEKEESKFYLLDQSCDVINFNNYGINTPIRDLHIDISVGGIIHIWGNRQDMKNIFRLSTCEFNMIEKEKE